MELCIYYDNFEHIYIYIFNTVSSSKYPGEFIKLYIYNATCQDSPVTHNNETITVETTVFA
jgi:hypothetical protein